ncbi:conserved hypothetical protein [Gluconacetobacter diazotrophicus PA1 5]|uniref:Uncharacterized protein n=2 Tax=Gluconacetobacter diazotrophicus TaxID=33996 RepID=A9H9H1_GLUDA|nr:hypothetical protein [Gluconacetobacter diazotrophicus]ACI52382.1 conserved hypothetical protein [Gluconacetobacter diazotrophicus PA1 5]MBB2158076.1 hypothetical protein [Gluconacetobacter diazotrophicus]TWB05521.1 hypothetical protein FBZ86_11613 [Gluconacetobacter diazotrophicus]CAP57708.1 hypothetical protein GDI3765 [Gluconacetobacter diazotrophicus PA1 5]
MRRLLAVACLCAFSAACTDDRGTGALHAAVSRCLARYPFRKGTAYDRFRCIAAAHFRYGPDAIGPNYDLVSQTDMASLRIGLDVDAGTLDVPEAETALRWAMTKAQNQAIQRTKGQGTAPPSRAAGPATEGAVTGAGK